MLYESGDTVYVDMDWDTAGYVFQRVFQGAPQLGSWYYETDLVELDTNYDPGAGAQIFTPDTFDAGFQPTQQIPEPATMSLLGLGALAMAMRRRRS